MNKKNSDITLKTVSFIIVVLFIGFAAYYSLRFLRCFSDAKTAASFPSYDMVHVVVYGISSDTVSAHFTLYSSDGMEIASVERSWNAQHLYIDFSSACFNDREFVFPYKIYGNMESRNSSGTKLSPYYMENGRCLLFANSAGRKRNRALYHLGVFAIAKTVSYFNKFSKVHTIDLSNCISGKEYAIYVYTDGTFRLVDVDE
jgi:hypothetical protein